MSLFNVGLSGLNSASMALRSASNNISNANTPGYNREVLSLEERSAGGVAVSRIDREFDGFIAGQLNRAKAETSSLAAYNNQISQIDRLLADEKAGLAPIMQSFFSALQDVAANPSDLAARQGVLGTANTVGAQFKSFDDYLRGIEEGINSQISQDVTQINNTTRLIAESNKEIALVRARTGEAPTALLNQRDKLVSDLNERIGTKLFVQDGGSYNVTLANGQPLVAGDRSYELEAVTSSEDPTQKVVAYRDSGGNLIEPKTSLVRGGSIGGLLEFRSEVIGSVRNELGRIAVTLGTSFNEQHTSGTDLNGAPGAEFWSVPAPTVFSNERNSGSAIFTGSFDDVTALTAMDYRLVVTDSGAGEFSITASDGSITTAILDGAGELNIDGVTLAIDDPALLADGDSYVLQPTRRGGSGLSVQIAEPAEIAAAQGAGTGDNRNALALQDIQSANLIGGSATLNGAYAGLVGSVGNNSAVAKANLDAQANLQTQIQQLSDSQSGVNLDEEAANLIRYQQFYQANAKVIETATSMFDIVLNLKS